LAKKVQGLRQGQGQGLGVLVRQGLVQIAGEEVLALIQTYPWRP